MYINAIIAIVVLSFALVVLYRSFDPEKKPNKQNSHKRKLKKRKVEPTIETVPVKSNVCRAEYAAIATAIHLYGEELHDVENAVLTINKVSRTYSPWSSKIHGLNTYFRR